MKARVRLGLLLVVPLVAAVSGFAQGTISIIGILHSQNGDFPANRVEVLLETRGAVVGQTYADDEGRFGFYGLDPNLYHVVIQDPDYVSVDQEVELNPTQLQQTTTVSIFLTPRDSPTASERPSGMGPDRRMMNSSQTSAQEKPQKGSNPYLTSVADYNRHFPHDAVKEFEKGAEDLRKSKLDDARKHYEKALKIAPNFYPARNDLGTVYLQKRDFAGAQQQFQQVIQENPNDPSAYFNMANIHLLIQDYDTGLRYVSQGLGKLPNAPNGLFIQGSLYRHMGKYPEAERCLRDAIKGDPTLANAHLELANLYRQEEDRGAMVAELQAFLKLYPNNPLCPQVKSALQKLGGAKSAN